MDWRLHGGWWSGVCRVAVLLGVLWVALTTLFFGISWSVSGEPSGSVLRHGGESMKLLEEEGVYSRKFGGGLMQKDNFTDALIITDSSVDFGGNRMERALACPMISFNTQEGLTPDKAGHAVFERNDGECLQPGGYYGRYWHGYRGVVRPLLHIFDLRGIRAVSYIFSFFLFGLALFLLTKRIGKVTAAVFAASFFLTGFWAVPDTLQFSTVYILTMLAVVFCLLPDKKRFTDRFCCGLFFVIGGVTVFFDFLTTPVMTLGFPLVIVFLRREGGPDYRILALCVISWGLGYGGLWATKWLLASLLTNQDIIRDALGAASQRASAALPDVAGGRTAFQSKIFMACVSAGGWFIVACRLLAKGKKGAKAKAAFPIALTALLPVCWLVLLPNHSVVHFWFVWRVLSVSIFAGGVYIYLVFSRYKFHIISCADENSGNNSML